MWISIPPTTFCLSFRSLWWFLSESTITLKILKLWLADSMIFFYMNFWKSQCIRIHCHWDIFDTQIIPELVSESLLKLPPRPSWPDSISWAFPIFLSHQKSRLTCTCPFPRPGISYSLKNPHFLFVGNIAFMRNNFASLFYMPALCLRPVISISYTSQNFHT